VHEELPHEPPGNDAVDAPHPVRGPDFANVGQETAELDMRTVLDAPEAVDPSTRFDPAGPAAAHNEDPAVGDALGDGQDFPRDTPGQERLWLEQAPRDFDFDK
jgi:hypothetical protein